MLQVQRDMNPLGSNLSKASSYWTRKRTMEEMMFPTNNSNSKQMSKGYMKILDRYKAEKLQRYWTAKPQVMILRDITHGVDNLFS